MRKVDDGESKIGNKQNGKIILFIMSTNVFSSLPPERRPSGTPTAGAKKKPYF